MRFTVDETAATFGLKESSGVTVDEDEGVSIDWDDVKRVTVDDAPWNLAFDSDEFYKIPSTVARPVPQQYFFDSESNEPSTWLKPRSELQRAAWSLDNKPWTIEHPSNGAVSHFDQVHGFFRSPKYSGDDDNLDADLHLPVADEDAKAYLADNPSLSVGFHWKEGTVDEYDGELGTDDVEPTDIDGLQVDLLFDHVASVEVGRCSLEQGCGIRTTADADEDVDAETDTDCTMSCDKDNPLVGVDSLTVDALAEQNAAVEQLQADAAAAHEELSELQTELDSATDKVSTLEEAKESLEEKVDSFERDSKSELVSDLIENSSRFEEDDEERLFGKDEADLEELHAIVMDTEPTESTTDSAGKGTSKSEKSDYSFAQPQTASPW